eukprot:jgi/Tetstr1/454128/TSEL_041047.t1
MRWMFIWLAVRLATRLHEATYVETVYGKKEPPPKFRGCVTNIVVLMIIFHVALLAVVNTMTESGWFPSRLREYVISESLVYMGFMIAASYFIAQLVQTKRYFNYRKDGIRAIRVYKELLIWAVFPISVSPIFFTT